MKNLTAHYNIYYNANELLKESAVNIRAAHKDNYDQLIDIFPLSTESSSESEKENLNEVITKANKIALEKFESNWVDDAFLLLAKSEYLKGNFFNSAEYFGYVTTNFPHKKELKNSIEALVWQGKSLFALQEYKLADSVLQLAYAKNLKHHRAILNAAIANSYIQQNKKEQAIAHLQKAINFTKDRYEKIRWSFVLAQLQEDVNDIESAFKNYSRVVKSNSSFEMSFNANLAQIRLKESANGIEFNKIATLTRLLKEDKNKEFKDQIYYQIAKSYEQQGDLETATEFYKTSAHELNGSAKQKGLSYLRLAEINFDSLKNYVQAQLYYDSTLQSLPKEYPDYNSIATKAKNLQYLADRLIIIETQQELLRLANLSEDERLEFANQEAQKIIDKKQAEKEKELNDSPFSDANSSRGNKLSGSFYFDNSTAISQGLSEFKKKWGTRQLQDNWRVSAGVGNYSNNQNANNITNVTKPDSENIDSLRKNILKDIPLTLADQKISTDKIKNARYEIAIFYKETLEDNVAAIEVLEKLVTEYSSTDPKVAELYYQLYRLYEPINISKSNLYKSELVKRYPESVFAKAIVNPDFGKEEEAALNNIKQEYESLYNRYLERKYSDVISKINGLEPTIKRFPTEAPQFLYLRSLAIGHTQKAPIFIASLNDIISNYPKDSTVTSLAKAQLSFIEKNKETFNRRKTALLNYDAQESYLAKISMEQVVFEKVRPEDIAAEDKTPINPNTKAPDAAKVATSTAAPTATAPTTTKPLEPEKPKAIAFSNNARVRHVLIIDIKNSSLNVAKPFAALTKYFYSKFDPSTVNLTIRTIGNTNKLIAVRAQFNSKDQAEKALAELSPSLKEILGLEAKEYGYFTISETNLLLITNTEGLNQYLNYNK